MTDKSYLDTLRELNPVAPEEVAVLDRAPERNGTYESIVARRADPEEGSTGVGRARARRRTAFVIACALALALPAFAFGDDIRSLFGFANEGTSIDQGKFRLTSAGPILAEAEAEGTVKLLASRAGTHFYVARGKTGAFCFFIGPPDLADARVSGGCWNMRLVREGSAERAGPFRTFPSPELPVLDMSSHRSLAAPEAVASGQATVLGSPEAIVRLRGVAADGVARMQVIGPECEVLAEAPVSANVYATEELAKRPAVAIIGLDHSGKRVFDEKLRHWATSPCAVTSGR